MEKSVKNNPWQREGVSILPKAPKDLMPIVGQKRLFDMLSRFRETLVTPSANQLSGFFVLHGGWCEMEGARVKRGLVFIEQPESIESRQLKQIFTGHGTGCGHVKLHLRTRAGLDNKVLFQSWLPRRTETI